MKFHEQRRSPSRPLFSRARACPCPRRLCYEKPMPAAHAVVLGPEGPPNFYCSSPPSAQGPGSRLQPLLVRHDDGALVDWGVPYGP